MLSPSKLVTTESEIEEINRQGAELRDKEQNLPVHSGCLKSVIVLLRANVSMYQTNSGKSPKICFHSNFHIL